MAYVYPTFEKRRQQVAGGSPVTSSFASPQPIQQQSSGFSDPVFEQRRNTVLGRPQEFKGVSGTQFIQEPITQKTQQESFISKAKSTIGSIDVKNIGKSIVGGVKQLPSQLKQSAGIIIQGVASQQRAIEKFLSPLR